MEQGPWVSLYGPTLDLVWRTLLHGCPGEEKVAGPVVVGAFGDGVWVLWDDVTPPDRDGQRYTLAKVALLRPDGTFAWH